MALGKVVCVLITFVLSRCFGQTTDIKNESEQNCTCVPYYQCSYESGDLITDGKGLLDMR